MASFLHLRLESSGYDLGSGEIAIIEIDGQEYYTMHEACSVLGIKPASLYAYVSRGRLRSYRQGMRRQRLYLRTEVDALAKLSPSREIELPLAESWVDIH